MREKLAQDFKPLACRLGCLIRQAGYIAPRPRQARDESAANWIICRPKHNRNNRCHPHRRTHSTAGGDDNIDLVPDELARDLSKALLASLRPAILDCDGAAID